MIGKLILFVLSLLMMQAPIQFETTEPIHKDRDHVLVAILDSGVDTAHPLLKDRLMHDKNGGVGINLIEPEKEVTDQNGHGTHTAGIIAQLGKVHTRIFPIKVVSDDGTGSVDALIQGIDYAVMQHADIILVSLGTPFYREDLAMAVRNAWKAGALLISATGNNGSNKVMYPAGNLYTIGVSASTTDECEPSLVKEGASYQVSPISNWGNHVSVIAPGDRICSATPTYPAYLNKYGFKMNKDALRGTSQAAAFLAGSAAAYWTENPQLTNTELYQKIEQSAFTKAGKSWDERSGYGLIDLSGTSSNASTKGGIYGQVENKGLAAADAYVRLTTGEEAVTGEDGMFRIPNLEAGIYHFEVTMMDRKIIGQVKVNAHEDSLLFEEF